MRQGDHSKIYGWEHTDAESETLFRQAYAAASEIIETGKLEEGDILVVGGSRAQYDPELV